MFKEVLRLEKVYVATPAIVVESFLSAFRSCFAAQKLDIRASYTLSRKSAKVLIEFVNQNRSVGFDKCLKNEFIAHLDLWGNGELNALECFCKCYFSKDITCFEGVFFISRDRELYPFF